MLLLAAGDGDIATLTSELESKESYIKRLEVQLAWGAEMCRTQNCTQHCRTLSLTGRWKFGEFGHKCVDPFSGKAYCHCSDEEDELLGCAEVLSPNARRLRKEEPVQSAPSESLAEVSAHGNDAGGTDKAQNVSVTSINVEVVDYAVSLELEARRLGSESETVQNYCNATGVLEMRGANTSGKDSSELNGIESSVLSDVADEMENNNVDKVARDIFTFYVCLRWVPDDFFWTLVRQELAANLVDSIVDHNKNAEHAVAELYQNYKFVPLLCSNNYNVFDETDPEDNTYFRSFKKKIANISKWMEDHQEDDVSKRLMSIDEIFCGTTNMNDPNCARLQTAEEWLNWATAWMGSWGWNAPTVADKWKAMTEVMRSFSGDGGAGDPWSVQVAEWRRMFPYHSFFHKSTGLSSSQSPNSTMRYLVCYGKRVASELHRRPTGQHIMTDQNNIGCHGFWDLTEVKGMLDRMVDLWKPPTCQLAEMTYEVKREILRMFADLNRRLFDALPSLLMDEELTALGLLDAHSNGPPPYDPKSVDASGKTWVDNMRVQAKETFRWPDGCVDWTLGGLRGERCEYKVDEGDFGFVNVSNGLAVHWDKDKDAGLIPVSDASKLKAVPHDWIRKPDLTSFASDFVSGITRISASAMSLFNRFFTPQYVSLGNLMSGSVSKWVVCPVRDDVNLTELDSQLGVEDAAFQDHQREAYAKWTGYKAKSPGEECETPDFFSTDPYPGAQVCEFSELHADHLEKYTNDDGQLEQFLCPLKQALPWSEQLTVLKEHKGKCFLRMTKEQQRHYQWPYNGDYPSRRQFDRKPNMPKPEFELIKLLKVPTNGTVSWARYCSADELVNNPRFCALPKLRNAWPSLAEMAKALASALVGSWGAGAFAVAGGIGDYARVLSQADKEGTDIAVESAQLLGEHVWGQLTGAARLVGNTAANTVNSLSYNMAGASERDARLDEEIFEEGDGGLLLHQLSFQRSIGSNNRTSNAKERYQRFVVSVPCPDFNPALEFSVGKQWTLAVLRMLTSARKNSGTTLAVLGQSMVELVLRGEGRFQRRDNSQASDDVWINNGAGMKVANGEIGETAKCVNEGGWFFGRNCEPSDQCITLRFGCAPKVTLSSTGWWDVGDVKLIEMVAPTTSSSSLDASDYKGLSVKLYCGTKEQFKNDGLPLTTGTFLSCLQEGVESNSRVRATSPWKLYHSDEVVVVARFDSLSERLCKPKDGSPLRNDICSNGATETADLDAHIEKGDQYEGLFTGMGFPRSTPEEVVMRPEDVLEAVGEMSRTSV